VFSFSFPLQPGTKQFPDKLYVFSKGTRNYNVTGTNLMLHTILRENDSMGHSDCQQERRTRKASTKTPETNSTSWNATNAAGGSVFLVVLIPASPVHPFAQLLPEKLKGGVDHP